MKKTLMVILAALVLIAAASMTFAEVLDSHEVERSSAITVVQNNTPDAEINYAVRERDDGRYEWDIFFRQNGILGEAEVVEGASTVRQMQLFDQSNENSLTADEAMAKLAQEKGEMTIVSLDLDWDDGRLSYEGEAEMNNRRYEFEITADGVIIEWERD